jgi:hypothetical protein
MNRDTVGPAQLNRRRRLNRVRKRLEPGLTERGHMVNVY